MEYLILFVVVIFIVLWGISIYFVKTGKLSAHDWSLRSLRLPQGSVRALFYPDNPIFTNFLHRDQDRIARLSALAGWHPGDGYWVLLLGSYGAEGAKAAVETRGGYNTQAPVSHIIHRGIQENS